MSPDRIPVVLVTGFLGSGKTTLLQRLLDASDFADTAVLINELGAISIDHAIVGYVAENIVVLANGCLCCAVRDDLGKALRDLLARRARGEVCFRRIAIETTGLADPTPILHTLMTDPVIGTALAIAAVITTVDAVNAGLQRDRQPEWIKQIAVADHIVVTKTEMTGAEPVDALVGRLSRINPLANVVLADQPVFDPATLLAGGSWDVTRLAGLAAKWTGFSAEAAVHDQAVAAHSFFLDEALEWTGFGVWFSLFLHRHGADVLRVKAMLRITGEPGPVVLHGVQHVVHPPVHLARWPDVDTRSRFVFITRGISGKAIAASLLAFSRAAGRMRLTLAGAHEIGPAPAGTEIAGRPVRRNAGLAWMKRAVVAAPRTSAD